MNKRKEGMEGKERKGKERKGKERKGKERKGKERKGKERKGKERKGKERKGYLLHFASNHATDVNGFSFVINAFHFDDL
jgi:hypothetical protein